MIFESKQGFSTFDTLTLIGSIVVLVLIVAPILNRRVDSEYTERAHREAQEWAQRIPLAEKTSVGQLDVSHGRSPASAGAAANSSTPAIGQDPWGKPFRYEYIRNSQGQPIYLAVWSTGPDSQSETQAKDLSLGSDGSLAVRFQGDDIGFVRAVR